MRKRRKQQVLSAPAKLLVGSYKTKSGQTKNRYRANPDSKQIKEIMHIT
jgi:hypothetical protein